jgi:hypothetical protein
MFVQQHHCNLHAKQWYRTYEHCCPEPLEVAKVGGKAKRPSKPVDHDARLPQHNRLGTKSERPTRQDVIPRLILLCLPSGSGAIGSRQRGKCSRPQRMNNP